MLRSQGMLENQKKNVSLASQQTMDEMKINMTVGWLPNFFHNTYISVCYLYSIGNVYVWKKEEKRSKRD